MISEILLFILIGFMAQLVDGALGMAYGLISTSMLLSLGVPVATASASVHAAEVFTTGISGFAHWRLKNIDFSLVKRLAPAGMLGGIVGAYLLTTIPADPIKLVVSLYLIIMGAVILLKGLRRLTPPAVSPRRIPLLGLTGGFLDAIGGGGWGPLVTSNLLGKGTAPRYAIGSTNLSEFFVTFTISLTFVFTIGLELWPIITGLIIGGAFAAPIAAYAARHLPARILLIAVGVFVIALSLKTLLSTGSKLFFV